MEHQIKCRGRGIHTIEGSGRGAVFWYPREALSVESIGVGRRWSVRDSVRSDAAGREQRGIKEATVHAR